MHPWPRVLLLLFCAAASALAQGNTDRPLVITFADVGQGDLVSITTPEHKRIIVDAGRSAETAARALHARPRGDTIDLVVASHNHADHIGGMPWVFARFHVRAYMDNGVAHTSRVYRATLRAAEREAGMVYLRANWLRTAKVPRVHVLKASHHGATNGATRGWIAATRPGVVVIPVSSANEYGHPAPAVVSAWRRAGAKVYRTDETKGVVITAWRDGRYAVTLGGAIR